MNCGSVLLGGGGRRKKGEEGIRRRKRNVGDEVSGRQWVTMGGPWWLCDSAERENRLAYSR